MGQSAKRHRDAFAPVGLWTFRTPLGWFGVAGQAGLVHWMTFGHPSQNAALHAAKSTLSADPMIQDWFPELRRRLEEFCTTGAGNFADVKTTATESTDFARQVIRVVRKIPPGATLSYGEVAASAGSPGAARAVGNIMARNPIPIIIPCHRVTASGGRLGGYSSPQGLSMKLRLLALEGIHLQGPLES